MTNTNHAALANTLHHTLRNGDAVSEVPEVMVATDAYQAGATEKLTAETVIGMPCSVSIGSDTYAGRVVGCTASLFSVTVVYGYGDREMTFRKTKNGYTYRKHHHLTLGVATQRLDEGF